MPLLVNVGNTEKGLVGFTEDNKTVPLRRTNVNGSCMALRYSKIVKDNGGLLTENRCGWLELKKGEKLRRKMEEDARRVKDVYYNIEFSLKLRKAEAISYSSYIKRSS